MSGRRYVLGLCALVAGASIGCAERGDVRLELGALERQAALDGIQLDEIVLRVSGPGFEPIEEALTPTTETVSLQIPAGPARRFELLGIRRIDAPDLPELPAYFGEVEQAVTLGRNEIRLPYREQGAINLEPDVLGGLTLNPDTRLTIVDESGAQLEIPVDQSVVVPAGRYRFVSPDSDPALLRAPSSLEIDVGVGQFVPTPVPLFNQDTQCLIDAPDSVRDEPPGCADLDFEVFNLDGANVTLRVNGVEVQVDADGNIVSASEDLVLNPGATIDVEFVSAGDNPRQECSVSQATGAETFDVQCGELLYPINFEVFGDVGDGFEVELRDGPTEELLDQIPVENSGSVATDFVLPRGPDFDGLTFNATEPVGSAVACRAVDRMRVVDGASAPIRIYCLSAPVPVYPESANLGDYVLNNGPDALSATGAPCPEDIDGFDACLHAGLFKRFVLPGYHSCDGLVVSDLAGALEWSCRTDGDEVQIFSHSLVSLRLLFNLQVVGGQDDRVPVAFDMLVSIEDRNQGFFLDTPGFTPWANPVANGNLVRDFDAPETIYILTEGAPGISNRFIEAPGVTLVVPNGLAVGGTLLRINGAPFSTISGEFSLAGAEIHIATADADWLTVTGQFSGPGSFDLSTGIQLPRQATVRHARFTDYQTGVVFAEPYGTLEDSNVESTFIGMTVDAPHSRIRDTAISNVGVGITNSQDLAMEDLTIRDTRMLEVTLGTQLQQMANIHITGVEVIRRDSSSSGGINIINSSNVVVRHTSVSAAENGAAFEVNQPSANIIFEGIVGQGRNGFTVRSGIDVVLRDSGVFAGFRPVQITDGSVNVRAQGTFVFADNPAEELNCTISDDSDNIGFLPNTCSASDGTLPSPSSAIAINLSSSASPGFTEPDSNDLTLLSTSPLAGLSPDPALLAVDTMVWLTDVSDAEDCETGFFGSVYNAESGTCETTFLHHADEVEGDGDHFCESGERCVYLPDPGAAQRPAESFVELPIDRPGATDIRLLVPQLQSSAVQ
ncbi:MAG: right-handed parallel beta-helix repeat-containing protein [Myxococcota bacterium]